MKYASWSIPVQVEWLPNGNPVTWCSWCHYTHEYTVKRADGTWTCEISDAIEQAMYQDLARLMQYQSQVT